jgi:hypothetical protein
MDADLQHPPRLVPCPIGQVAVTAAVGADANAGLFFFIIPRQVPPEIFEPMRAQLGVALRVLDAVVAEPPAASVVPLGEELQPSILIVPFELPAWLACGLRSVELS